MWLRSEPSLLLIKSASQLFAEIAIPYTWTRSQHGVPSPGFL